MILATCRETLPGENRVSFVPDGIPALSKLGFEVVLESGAGEAAGFSDQAYRERGARLESRSEVLRRAQILCQFHAPSSEDLQALSPGATVVSLLYPLTRLPLVAQMAEKGLTVFALDLLPRISRAQSMDVLSSQSTVAGYRAVVLAASSLPRFFPMLMTPAGTIPPARVFVIGAGVAGLQAIATARRLGPLSKPMMSVLWPRNRSKAWEPASSGSRWSGRRRRIRRDMQRPNPKSSSGASGS